MMFADSSLSNRRKGALLYGIIPVCVLCESEHPGHLNVRGVLRHFVPNKGLYPLRRFRLSTYSKRRDFVTPLPI